LNVTDTASNAASNLLDLQVGGVSKFKVGKTSDITIGGSWNDFTFNVPAGGGSRSFNIKDGSTTTFQVGTNGMVVLGYLAMGASTTSPDILLQRDAANALGLRNGIAAQTLNIYGTFTSITDYKRLALTCSNTNGTATISAPFNTTGLTITGGSWADTEFIDQGNSQPFYTPPPRATITFATQTAALPIGSTVVVSGVTPAGYNGTYTVYASTTTSVTYEKTTNPGAWTSGGTATVSGTSEMTVQGSTVLLKGGTTTAIKIDSAGLVAIAGAQPGGSSGATKLAVNGQIESNGIVLRSSSARWVLTINDNGAVVVTQVYYPQ
jgi:hypothetical protein